jgi:hypothetical protein
LAQNPLKIPTAIFGKNQSEGRKLIMKIPTTQFLCLALAISACMELPNAARGEVNSTFDNSSSFVTSSNFPAFGSYGIDNPGSPAVPNARFDFDSAGNIAPSSISWSSQDAANNSSSGSLKVSWNFSLANGSSQSDFTLDLFNSAQTFDMLSFDIMVDPSSAADSFGGYGDLQVFTRDGLYTVANTGFNEELGNPDFNVTGDAGTWEHVTIPLSGFDSSVRAITFRDFEDVGAFGRNINGPVTIYIDNLTLAEAPEPSAAALSGLCLVAIIFTRRFWRTKLI